MKASFHSQVFECTFLASFVWREQLLHEVISRTYNGGDWNSSTKQLEITLTKMTAT